MEHNIVSLSGGKDSTATYLLARERNTENLSAVFADTGNEHPLTYEYVDYLENTLNINLHRVANDFSEDIEHKRHLVQTKWRQEGIPENNIERALAVLKPTGNPFLDMCLSKGRFPNQITRFCTDQLKIYPIHRYLFWPLLQDKDNTIISWQGIRRNESKSRANALEREGIEPDATRVFTYRPILDWTADDVFNFHRKHNIKWNPLYESGMSRVGCMPCIFCRKSELRMIASRFPDEVERIMEWEHLVSEASKKGVATFFNPSRDTSKKDITEINLNDHGIDALTEWAKTSRGGRQYDLIELIDEQNIEQCSSVYGLCE